MGNPVPRLVVSGAGLERLELSRIKKRTERLFAAIEEALELGQTEGYESFNPAIDICESGKSVRIVVEVPGVEESSIEVTASAKELVIEGQKARKILDEKATSHLCCERGYGTFRRSIHLNWPIDLRKVTAELENGILVIVLPKLDDRRGKSVKIDISVNDG
ncbi:MAG: Hsp20/alpha crystallin family protein [Pyrinomonadaceae bacterium]